MSAVAGSQPVKLLTGKMSISVIVRSAGTASGVSCETPLPVFGIQCHRTAPSETDTTGTLFGAIIIARNAGRRSVVIFLRKEVRMSRKLSWDESVR